MKLKHRPYRIFKSCIESGFPELREAVIKILQRLIWQSKSETEVAGKLGIHRITLWRFKLEFPEIWEAALKKKGVRINRNHI